MAIAIRNTKEIEALSEANRIVAHALDYARTLIYPGAIPLEISCAIEKEIIQMGGRASFKGLYGFPEAVCISINEVIIHGIPTNSPLKEGDIVGIDLGVEKHGWYGDAAFTIGVGEISNDDLSLIACAKDSLMYAISEIREGMRFKELSALIEEFILQKGYVPLKSYCGHGIGRKPHEEPSILNYLEGKSNQGPKIKNGMVFCVEPMICHSNGEAKVLDDKWSVVAFDGQRGSHYEHTVAIIDGKARILSQL